LSVGSLKKAILFFIVSLLVVGFVAGVVYYRPQGNPSPLIAVFNVAEMGNNEDLMNMFPELNPEYFYECLWIHSHVTNTGKETVYNTGLIVLAYATDGGLRFNTTVPFTSGTYGTDSATNVFASSHPLFGTYTKFESTPWKVFNVGSLELESLSSEQTQNFTIAIFHDGKVANWNITPSWTNVP
jgi:hypothetical protein